MGERRFAKWGLPLLMLGVLVVLLLLLVLYPAHAQQRPELLEMSVIAREADGAAWANARQGMEQAAADLQVELRFLYPSQSNSSQDQEQLLRREVESGSSAILLFPSDREALGEAVSEAAARAALVTLETDMSAQGAAGYAGVDNAALGEALAAAALNGARPGETVLLLDSAPGENGIRERLAAAEALLKSEGREVRLLTGGTDALAEALARENIRALIALETSSLERASAVVSRMESPPLLYGAGFTAAIAAGLEQGQITSAAAQNAFSTGYLAVETAACLARREAAEPLEPLPFLTVRRENLYEPEYQQLLFPVTW